MKRILIFCLIGMLFGGCDDLKDQDMVFMHSYIPFYIENSWTAHPYKKDVSNTGKYYLLCSLNGGTVYRAPELGGTGENAERFLAIAEQNGDRTYDREVNVLVENLPRCSADNYTELRVRCLNAAWDNGHAAGTDLSDIAVVEYVSYAAYVRCGYPKGEASAKGYKKRLQELKDTDLSMITDAIYIYFTNLPPAGSYEMEVTFVTTEGEEKSATCTLAIE